MDIQVERNRERFEKNVAKEVKKAREMEDGVGGGVYKRVGNY